MIMAKIDEVKSFAFTFVIAFLITLIIVWVLVSPKTHKVMDGINTIDFLGLCEFDFFDRTVLTQVTIAMRCPGFDYMKIWPFPIEQPWEGEITQLKVKGPEL